MPRFVSIDLETSGLDPRRHEIIEVGMVCESGRAVHPDMREADVLRTLEFSLPFDRQLADPRALEINGWGQREFAPLMRRNKAVEVLGRWLDGAYIVGKNPSFDVGFLTALFAKYGDPPCWHHRLVDVGAMAWGWYNAFGEVTQDWQEFPPDSERVMELVGVQMPEGARHSALGDAGWAYQVFRKMVPKDG